MNSCINDIKDSDIVKLKGESGILIFVLKYDEIWFA